MELGGKRRSEENLSLPRSKGEEGRLVPLPHSGRTRRAELPRGDGGRCSDASGGQEHRIGPAWDWGPQASAGGGVGGRGVLRGRARCRGS